MSRSSLNHLTKDNPDALEVLQLLSQIGLHSDRECAIVCVSLVEHQLQKLLCRSFVPMTSTEEKELFDGTAPLSTFAAKIKMAYALRIIDKTIRDDLERIRKIRNVFAHTIKPIGFHEPDIVDWCNRLKMKRPPGPRDQISPTPGSRAKFAYLSAIEMLWLFLQGPMTGSELRKATRPAPSPQTPAQ